MQLPATTRIAIPDPGARDIGLVCCIVAFLSGVAGFVTVFVIKTLRIDVPNR